MGLLDQPVAEVESFLKNKEAAEIDAGAVAWPGGFDMVLKEDTALELGAPGDGSLFMVHWTKARANQNHAAYLLGPELKDLPAGQNPFALAATVYGNFNDDYDAYRMLMDALYETKLDGVSVRLVPTRGGIWCRISRRALEGGFSFDRWAAALIENFSARDSVIAARILFVTSGYKDIAGLFPIAKQTGSIIGAMKKMVEDMDCDCASCEYEQVCKGLDELKIMRRRMAKERNA